VLQTFPPDSEDATQDPEFCSFNAIIFQDPGEPRAHVLQDPIQETTIICQFDASRLGFLWFFLLQGIVLLSAFSVRVPQLQVSLEHSTSTPYPPFQMFGGPIPSKFKI
jgi:hypothetical protein